MKPVWFSHEHRMRNVLREENTGMKRTELNYYIYNYVKNDLTHGALLLCGSPSSGKSHYLRSDLIPYLKNTPEAFSCITVSLYGPKDLAEVSRNVFLENRAKLFRQKSEKASVGMIMAKTLIKNLAKFYKLDLTADKEDVDSLYSNADLAEKLVIFEDADKSEIDPEELLKYISSLTQQDGVKVLLVMEDMESDRTPEMIKLREVLEKGCSDVLLYEPDMTRVIKNVIAEYWHPVLNGFDNETDLQEMIRCFEEHGSFNIRTLFFACQKSVDLYRRMDTDNKQYDPVFLKSIFLGILQYYLRMQAAEDVEWGDEDQLSFRIGSNQYPMFKFCYDYIRHQIYEPAQVMKAQALYKEFRDYDQRSANDDPDLEILYTWDCQKESDLTETVNRITERLKEPGQFLLQEYGKIAYRLLQIKNLLHCDITAAEEQMIANLFGKGLQVNSDYITRELPPADHDSKLEKACAELRGKMLHSLKKVDTELLAFSYQPSQIEGFTRFVQSDIGSILKFGAFAQALDNHKIQAMLKECSAREIHDFRKAYTFVYSIPNCQAYLGQDEPALEELSALVKELEKSGEFDKIQRMNLQDFARELDRITEAW